jgi:NADPH2:quinone reductase
MKAIRANEKSSGADSLKIEYTEVEKPNINSNQCLIEIKGSCINPSDAKGLLGVMPDLTWPRIPGRDYSGVVIEGPDHLVGKEVWGGGSGPIGMARDGAHAEYLAIDVDAVSLKPENISFLEAGGIGVPFTAAYMGLIDGANVKEDDYVVVFGANGNVGQAVIQLATQNGAKAIGIDLGNNKYTGHASKPVNFIEGEKENIVEEILARTNGKGADIIFNTVGSPCFEAANKSLAKEGRQIIISTIKKDVTLDLRQFYRGNHRLIGVSNMDLTETQAAEILNKLIPGFENNTLQAYPISDEVIFNLKDAQKAYEIVLNGSSKNRVYIQAN